MACVYQKRGRWYAQINDGLGRRRQVALSATTKTEAKRLSLELERKAERQRLGLEALPSDVETTLGELCIWWLKERCPEASLSRETSRLRKHVISQPIGGLPLPHVTPAVLEDRFRAMEADGLSPATVNGLRRILHVVFSRAEASERWIGRNPVEKTEARRVSRRAYVTLRAEEVPVLLAHLTPAWRGIFATALYTGMRKGEIYGLLRSRVDLAHRILLVGASYGRQTTKGRREEPIPIAAALVPFLREALEAHEHPLVFPRQDGTMRSEKERPELVLRRALGRAGIVEGWDHICRRCKGRGRPHVERHQDAARRTCPQCGMALWPRPLPRPLRFHDLRHTTATLLLRDGIAPQIVQRILRHTDVAITTGIYGHLDVEDLRAAVDRLPAAPPPEDPPLPTRRLPGSGKAGSRRKPTMEAGGTTGENWRALQGSNLRPSDSKSDALSS